MDNFRIIKLDNLILFKMILICLFSGFENDSKCKKLFGFFIFKK